MIDVNQLRRGRTFLHDGQIFKVTDYSHHKPGRGKATIRVNVRNVRTGTNRLLTFNSSERVEDIRVEKRTQEFIYADGDDLVFMDTETFEQVSVPKTLFGDDALLIRENDSVELLSYEMEVIDYKLPQTVEMEVVDAEAAIAGDRVSGATKEVTLETGYKVKTPLFVEVGDVIRVNTESGEYVTRV